VGAATNETQVICRSSVESASVKFAWGIGRQMDLAPIGFRDKGNNLPNSFPDLTLCTLAPSSVLAQQSWGSFPSEALCTSGIEVMRTWV
jgi:hypothetical protein